MRQPAWMDGMHSVRGQPLSPSPGTKRERAQRATARLPLPAGEGMRVRVACKGEKQHLPVSAYLNLRTTLKHAVTRFLAGGMLLLLGTAVQAATAPVGATPGTFAVSPSGAATYSIPIFVPPGTNGMQPQLSLNYNSQGGNGLIGMGWSLGGLSAIHRCGSTIAIDGIKGGVNYNANDKFCLDGERLIVINGTYGAAGSEYRTQHDSWQKVVAVGGTAGDPSYFTVTSKDGTVQYYGYDVDGSNSRIEAQGKTAARLWALNKIQDRNGNYLKITYQEDNANGDYRPTRIDYTGNGSVQPYTSVVFGYVEPQASRSDIVPVYEGGSVIKTLKRLTHVYTYAGASLAREYRLAYDPNGGAVGRSLLTSIRECVSDGTCLPETILDWSSIGTVGFNAASAWGGLTYLGPDPSRQMFHDVNGDGLVDWIHISGDGGAIIHLNNGSGGFNSTASFGAPGPGNTLSYLGNDPSRQKFIDVNGDGLPDWIHISGAGGGIVHLNNGQGGFNAASAWGGLTYLGPDPDRQNFADVNGDGLPDWIHISGAGGGIVHLNSGHVPDQLTQATNGFGAQTVITYKPLTDSSVYTKDNSAAYPYQDLQYAMHVVSQSTQNNGIGGNNATSYQYGGLKSHHTAATSLGFRWVQTTDPAGMMHVTYHNQTLDCTEGTVASSESWVSGVRVKYAGNTWTPVGLGAGRCYARLANSVEEIRELNNSVVSTVNTSYSGYDSYGNPGTVLVDFNDGWTKTTYNSYDNDTINWQLGKLTYSKVTATAPGQGSEYRESSFTYDSLGRVQTEVIEPNRSTLTLTTTYGYDGFGNRTSKTLSGPGIVSRTESQTFTANGQFPLTNTNALGHSESYVYHAKY